MKAWELLSDESKWTQGVSSRDAHGFDVGYSHPNSVCWCLYGAVRHCYPNTPVYITEWPTWEILTRGFGGCPIKYNDTHTYAEVHAKLKQLDI